jgi:polyhydroxybutyrate depolymerase
VADCDDEDPGLGARADDGDCDGVVAVADCDDADPFSTTRAVDGDCDGVENGDDVDGGASTADDPCRPDPDALACATGDSDGDGVQNVVDDDPEDPCAPVIDVVACSRGDNDRDGVENGLDEDPEDPCVPSVEAVGCDRGDTDGDGVANAVDVADNDPCAPNPNGTSCASGDADRDGTNNGLDVDDADACVPDTTVGACTRRSPGCGGAALDPAVFVDAGGAGEKTLIVDGVARDAAIRLPATYDDNRAYPIVFEFHGDQERLPGGAAAPLEPSSFASGIFGANEYDDDAIVVALHGINLLAPEVRDDFSDFVAWNSLTRGTANNDIAAVRAFKQFVTDTACVDPTKTFAAGFSGGGFFTQSLLCFDEDVTAVATFQGGFEGQPFPSTSGAELGFLRDDVGGFLRLDPASCAQRSVPALVVHGDADFVVVREQSLFVAERWAAQNGCGPLSGTSSLLDPACFEYQGCALGADVVWCEPPDVAHEVWSSPAAGTDVLIGFFARFFPQAP